MPDSRCPALACLKPVGLLSSWTRYRRSTNSSLLLDDAMTLLTPSSHQIDISRPFFATTYLRGCWLLTLQAQTCSRPHTKRPSPLFSAMFRDGPFSGTASQMSSAFVPGNAHNLEVGNTRFKIPQSAPGHPGQASFPHFLPRVISCSARFRKRTMWGVVAADNKCNLPVTSYRPNRDDTCLRVILELKACYFTLDLTRTRQLHQSNDVV